MLDTTDIEKQEKKTKRSPFIVLVLIPVLILGGWQAYKLYSNQKILVDLGYRKGLQSTDSFLEKCIGGKAEPTTSASFYEIIQKRIERNNSVNNVNQNKVISFSWEEGNKKFYGYECFDNFLGEKLFHDMYPGGVKLEDQIAKSALVDKYVNYCLDLPNKTVNSMILHDQAFVPDLSYGQFCFFVLTDHFTAAGNEKFTLSIDEFIEQFPKWQKPERAEYGVLKDPYGFRVDVSKYFCGKAYDPGESLLRSKCENPRPAEFYEALVR